MPEGRPPEDWLGCEKRSWGHCRPRSARSAPPARCGFAATRRLPQESARRSGDPRNQTNDACLPRLVRRRVSEWPAQTGSGAAGNRAPPPHQKSNRFREASYSPGSGGFTGDHGSQPLPRHLPPEHLVARRRPPKPYPESRSVRQYENRQESTRFRRPAYSPCFGGFTGDHGVNTLPVHLPPEHLGARHHPSKPYPGSRPVTHCKNGKRDGEESSPATPPGIHPLPRSPPTAPASAASPATMASIPSAPPSAGAPCRPPSPTETLRRLSIG